MRGNAGEHLLSAGLVASNDVLGVADVLHKGGGELDGVDGDDGGHIGLYKVGDGGGRWIRWVSSLASPLYSDCVWFVCVALHISKNVTECRISENEYRQIAGNTARNVRSGKKKDPVGKSFKKHNVTGPS